MSPTTFHVFGFFQLCDSHEGDPPEFVMNVTGNFHNDHRGGHEVLIETFSVLGQCGLRYEYYVTNVEFILGERVSSP